MLEDSEKLTKPLSPQEQIIVRKICQEKSTEQIAEELSISSHTVSNHRKAIVKKTHCTNLVALTKYALKNGLLD